MNTCEKTMRKNTQNPSFSSTLLDQIFRSIDESDKRPNNPVLCKETILSKKQSNVSDRPIEKDDVSSLRRARLVEQWMKRKVLEKMVLRGQHFSAEFDRKALYDNDPLFCSSSSCSSESSSGRFSSSGSEKNYRSKTMVSSCFAPMKLQKIRTNSSQKSVKTEERGDALFSIENNSEDIIIKSKLRTLKKMKQPISPGGRMSSFLNSIFTSKNTKNPTSNGGFHITDTEKTPKSTTCSSASSFSRSCLNKHSPSVAEKTSNGGKRRVKFYPVSAIMDEYPQKCVSGPPKTVNLQMIKKEEELKLKYLEKIEREEVLKHYRERKTFGLTNGDLCANHEDDAESDSSSDLFELDHLAFNCEELPVYETTTFVQTNLAIR